jgi:hypothetical protein
MGWLRARQGRLVPLVEQLHSESIAVVYSIALARGRGEKWPWRPIHYVSAPLYMLASSPDPPSALKLL